MAGQPLKLPEKGKLALALTTGSDRWSHNWEVISEPSAGPGQTEGQNWQLKRYTGCLQERVSLAHEVPGQGVLNYGCFLNGLEILRCQCTSHSSRYGKFTASRGEGGISSKRMVGISLRDQSILSSLERSSKTASVFRSHADISMTHPSWRSAEPSPQIQRLHTQYLYYVQPTESSLHILAFTIL